ncbi:multiheme c-type cytochrome [Bremerella cremea]|uniref:multiheme c-type cytochrome n=1 Tax=Bremerella cremea TaxID=1031537 RepID=UPI0031E86740
MEPAKTTQAPPATSPSAQSPAVEVADSSPATVNFADAKPIPSDSTDKPVGQIQQVAMHAELEEKEEGGANVPRRELFEGWPKPELALFLTGQQHGYIEPCGCTGLTNQKGGLMRRQTFLNQLRKDKGWDVVALDVGNQVRRFGRQAEIKFQTTANGLNQMDYEAISFGPDDLRLSVDEVFAAVASDDPDNIKYVSSNASLLGFTPKYRIVEAGGVKIGITGVLGSKEQQRVSNAEVEMGDPMEELKASWEALKAENCQLYVLLAEASLDESRKFAQAFPGFQIVVTAGGAGEPTLRPEVVAGTNTQMIQVGTKGMYVGVVGFFNDPQNPIRYERVALDSRFADSDEMLRLLAAYQKQLETLGFDGLGIRAQPHPSGHTYVGSDTCADCHSEAYEVWKNSRHSHATDSLVHPPERFQVSRHFDPECLACHVVGWNQELYQPYQSGYLSIQETPLMQNVGCENCHGPGSAHVASQNGEGGFTAQQAAELVEQMKLPLSKARDTCLKCHDLDNSPDFHVNGAFDKYWEEIKH